LAWLPVSGAETTGLESFKDAESFFDRSADVEGVHYLILQYAIGIDDKETAEGDAFVFEQYTVVTADVFGDVRGEYVFDGAETTLIVRGIDPGSVAVYRVGRNSEDFGTGLGYFIVFVAEGLEFGRADEGEVQWIEEQNEPFTFVIGKFDIVLQGF